MLESNQAKPCRNKGKPRLNMSMIGSDEADHTNACSNKGGAICAASNTSRLEPKQTCPQTGVELLQQVALLSGKTKSTCMKSKTEIAEPR